MKIFGVRHWVDVYAVNPTTGQPGDDTTRQGDLVGVEIGYDEKSIHQLSLSLDGARSLRAELSEVIADLEALESDDQLELPFDGDTES